MVTSTVVSRGRLVAHGDIDRGFAWQVWHLTGSGGALGPVLDAVTPRHFAWQAWRLVTSTFVSRGRRGTYGTWSHPPSFRVAGVALGDPPSFRVAPVVALMALVLAQQHLSLAPVFSHTPSFTHHLCHTPSFTHHLCHTPSFTHHLCHTPSFTHHLCHTPSFTHHFPTHTIFVTHHLSDTIFHTQLCHTPSFTHRHRPSLTHHPSHTTLSHTTFHT